MSQTLVQTGTASRALGIEAVRRGKPVRENRQEISGVVPNRPPMADLPCADTHSVSRIA